jgi:hypothetical protein
MVPPYQQALMNEFPAVQLGERDEYCDADRPTAP